MSEKSNKQKKCSVSDQELSTLLQRYTPTTVLALLQEVSQAREVNIDWNALVKKTKTGITNAREYQLLWRHLAYRQPLVDGLADGAQPLDDDSDLEYDLESYPAVSNGASVEAAAFVKVLIASGTLNDSHMSSGMTSEAPLTINIPIGLRSQNSSDTSQQCIPMQGSNIIVPVSVLKNPLPNVISTKGLDTNGASGSNLPLQRKRKLWSETEDLDLIAAVKRHGEGNWANIAKGAFNGYRTASQLSKRWAIIRKHQNASLGNKSKLAEIHLAHQALSLALDVPMRDNSRAACSITSVDTKSQHQGQPDLASNVAPKLGTLVPSKSLVSKIPSTKPPISTNSMVKAAAVAAGARIVSPSDAASLLKAVQSKNAADVRPGGGPVIKSSLPANKNAPLSNEMQVVLNPAAEIHINTVKDTALSGLEIVSEKVVTQENQASCPGITFRRDQIAASTRNSLLENAQGAAREKDVTTFFSDNTLKENSKGNDKASVHSSAPRLNVQLNQIDHSSRTGKAKIDIPFHNGNHAKKSCSSKTNKAATDIPLNDGPCWG